jgi:hypothetical protein
MKRQKISKATSSANLGTSLPAKVVMKRKSGYDVTPVNRAKILRTELGTEENQSMELDDAEKGEKGINEVD